MNILYLCSGDHYAGATTGERSATLAKRRAADSRRTFRLDLYDDGPGSGPRTRRATIFNASRDSLAAAAARWLQGFDVVVSQR